MKYIRLEYAGYIIFDQSQKHSDVAKKYPTDKVISAGFLNLMIEDKDKIQCYGESTSLNKSVEKIDEDMLFRRLSIYC